MGNKKGKTGKKNTTTELKKNLKEVCKEEKKDGDAAHHIVPQNTWSTSKDPDGLIEELQKKLKGADPEIDIHDCKNGVWLPQKGEDPPRTYHPTLHTGEYVDELWRRLENKNGRKAILRALRKAKTDLLRGEFFP